jgi:hypothetical protein
MDTSTRVFNIVMHGIYQQKQKDSFDLPNNVFVIFASRPGYKLHPGFLMGDADYERFKNSNDMFKKFLSGEIPGPRQFQRWRDHIYRPGDTIRNITFDGPSPTNLPILKKQFGIGYVGQQKIAPRQINLKSIVEQVSKKPYTTIIFVASCRTLENYTHPIPAIVSKVRYKENQNVTGLKYRENQNYNLPTPKRVKVELALAKEKRRVHKKRKRSPTPNNNQRTVKRLRLV